VDELTIEITGEYIVKRLGDIEAAIKAINEKIGSMQIVIAKLQNSHDIHHAVYGHIDNLKGL